MAEHPERTLSVREDREGIFNDTGGQKIDFQSSVHNWLHEIRQLPSMLSRYGLYSLIEMRDFAPRVRHPRRVGGVHSWCA